MRPKLLVPLVLAITFVSLSFSPAPAAMKVPKGFKLRKSFLGVALYSRSRLPRTEYMLVVDLELGAGVNALHGAVTDPGTGLGGYGGDDPAVLRQDLEEFWYGFREADRDAFAVTNGSFFDTGEFPSTHLAFPVKIGGEVFSDGYDIEGYPGQKLMLSCLNDSAEIVPFTPDDFQAGAADLVLAGLSTAAAPSPLKLMKRTLVGVRDPDNDGTNEVVLIYTARKVTEEQAENVLGRFGATRIMVLQGGGCTQMITKGLSYLKSKKTIPQSLAVTRSWDTPRGIYQARHRVVRAGSCNYMGSDDYTSEGDENLMRTRRGFYFEPAMESVVRARYRHADRAVVKVSKTVICNGIKENHTTTARATFSKDYIEIHPYRITWCESMNCVFDESWILTPAAGTGETFTNTGSGPPGTGCVDEDGSAGECR